MAKDAQRKPKIAVYSIAYNEEHLVRQWFENTKEADLHLIADNVSTDNTYKISKELGIKIHVVEVKPFRFDVARNAALSLIPEDFDVCIQLDLHETISPNWRQSVERAWQAGNSWPLYKKILARDSHGRILKYEHGFSIHPRKDFIWTYPIHEFVMPSSGQQPTRELINLEVNSPARNDTRNINASEMVSQFLSKNPRDWRMNYFNVFYGWANSAWDSVIARGRFALSLSEGNSIERSAINMWVSEAYLKLGQLERAIEFAKNASQLSPEIYETWHWRAHVSHMKKDWQDCFASAIKIETLTRQDHQLTKPEVWQWWGYDLVALSAHYLGKHDLAIFYGKKALLARPEDKRLNENLHYYEKGFRESVGRRQRSHRRTTNPAELLIKVINLDERLDRLEKMSENLNGDFEVSKAFDGSKIPELLASNALTPLQHHIINGLIALSFNKAESLPGIIGKWNSHLKIWLELAHASDQDQIVLVLEDDAIALHHTSTRISSFMKENVLFENILFSGGVLGAASEEKLASVESDSSQFEKVTEISHVSESAYFIRRSGAVKLISRLSHNLDAELPLPPLRTWLHQISKEIEFCYMEKPFFIQRIDSADSDIGAQVR